MFGDASKDGETEASAEPPPIPAETTVGWADTVWRHGTAPGAKLRWMAERLPTLRRPGVLESLVSPYVTSWGEGADVTAVLRSEARLHRLDALTDEALRRLAQTYPAYGWVFEATESFGVRHDTLIGGWGAYWARRPAAIRDTVRRKGKGASAVLAPPSLASMAVERLCGEAWRDGEPYPSFLPAVVERGYAEGWARTYILDSGIDVPAVQLWLVGGGRASLVRTWLDREAGPRHPGTVLTALVIERLAEEGIVGIDFGRDDRADPDAGAEWTAYRAQRWRLVARPWRSVGGIALSARITGKRALRRA